MNKRLLAVLLVAMMTMTLLPMAAFAATEFDISTGDLIIGDGDGDYIITGTTTGHTVTVTGGTHNITMKDASIDASGLGLSAFDINPGATVNLTLEGTNTLKSGDGRAPLRVPTDAALTIDGTGSLTAESNGSFLPPVRPSAVTIRKILARSSSTAAQ